MPRTVQRGGRTRPPAASHQTQNAWMRLLFETRSRVLQSPECEWGWKSFLKKNYYRTKETTKKKMTSTKTTTSVSRLSLSFAASAAGLEE